MEKGENTGKIRRVFNPLSNDKILDQSKSKADADDKMKVI